MNELHVLGETKTNPADNMTLDNVIDNLAETSTELLCFIAEELKTENEDNDLGIQIEHDAHNCKPWNTKDVEDLMACGIVTVHHSSGNGVMFMHCNEDVYESLVEFGEIFED